MNLHSSCLEFDCGAAVAIPRGRVNSAGGLLAPGIEQGWSKDTQLSGVTVPWLVRIPVLLEPPSLLFPKLSCPVRSGTHLGLVKSYTILPHRCCGIDLMSALDNATQMEGS